MNQVKRVMLCDDSAVMRRMIKTAIQADTRFQVVCEAQNGQDALSKLQDAHPDVLVMDIEMPVMDGVDAVREIRKRTQTLPIVMFSSLTSRGAEATMDAIAAGASDFATKPAGAGHIGAALELVRTDLLPKLVHWTKLSNDSSATRASITNDSQPARDDAPTLNRPLSAVSIVGIGVSTGGPQALAALLAAVPKNFPVPILIAQHMPPVFTGMLAERLASQTGHDVREATEGDELIAGRVLIAPGDYHMNAMREKTSVRIRLNQNPPEHSCRPSVNPLFRSIAHCYGKHALAVILTGMGEDGAIGAKQIKDSGGRVIVQDQASSLVWGMPGHAVRLGLADRVLPLSQMATELVRTVQPSSSINSLPVSSVTASVTANR